MLKVLLGLLKKLISTKYGIAIIAALVGVISFKWINKKYLFWILGIGAVAGYIGWREVTLAEYKAKTSTLANNVKAYENELIITRNKLNQETVKIIQYQATLSQFTNSNDSVFKVLNKARIEAKIKGKNLLQAGLIITNLEAKLKNKVDTIKTPIAEEEIVCDTLRDGNFIVNPIWHTGVVVASEVIAYNEQSILFDSKKETVEPRKKCFLLRWFQDKHRVVYIEVKNTNPYIHTKKNKFVEIID